MPCYLAQVSRAGEGRMGERRFGSNLKRRGRTGPGVDHKDEVYRPLVGL